MSCIKSDKQQKDYSKNGGKVTDKLDRAKKRKLKAERANYIVYLFSSGGVEVK
jgi:hypothetical protein